ncbi:hypothetical protein ACJX0J_015938 [Zea mays]
MTKIDRMFQEFIEDAKNVRNKLPNIVYYEFLIIWHSTIIQIYVNKYLEANLSGQENQLFLISLLMTTTKNYSEAAGISKSKHNNAMFRGLEGPLTVQAVVKCFLLTFTAQMPIVLNLFF